MNAVTPTISSLWYYPIKSCRGVALQTAAVGPRGILHDREFMVVDESGVMLTQRTHPRMALIAPQFQDDGALEIALPDQPALRVKNVDGERRRVVVWADTVDAVDQGDDVADALSKFLGLPARLVRIADDADRTTPQGDAPVSFADAYTFMGISDATLAELNGRLAEPIDMRRFRPNVTFAGTAAFDEDRWGAFEARGIVFRGVTQCSRCSIPSTDQDLGVVKREPAATLARYRRGEHLGLSWKVPDAKQIYFGRNFTHAGTGTIAVGDPIRILDAELQG